MLRVGEKTFTDVDTDGTSPANKFNAIYTLSLEESQANGPEFGWAFTNRRGSVDKETFTITAFANLVTDTTTTVTATHTLQAGDTVDITGTTSYNGTFVVQSVSTTISFVIKQAFVADDATGTAQWTSDEFTNRFATPTSLRLVSVSVGGVEIMDWITENEFILTSGEDSTIVAKYIQLITDTTKFPPHYVKVLSWRLAAYLAYDLSQNAVLGDRLLEELETVILPRAIGLDAKERFVEEQNQNWVLAGHVGGSRNNFNLPRFGGNLPTR